MRYEYNEHKKYKDLVEMYQKYIQELSEFNPELQNPDLKETQEYIGCIFQRDVFPGTDIITIYTDDDELCGFMILGTDPNCHTMCDYFIQEFYISPSFRRKHLGKQFISQFAQKHYGSYCLFILRKNEIAKKFWKSVFEELNASEVQLTIEPCGIDFRIAEQLGFKVSCAN